MALNTDINLKDYGVLNHSELIFCKITNENRIVNLKSYFCFLVGKNVTPAQRNYETIKLNKSFKRIIVNVDDNDDLLETNFLFVAKNRSVIWTNVRQFITQIEKCKIKFNTEEYYFDCIIKDWDIEFITSEQAILTVKFDAQAFTEKEKINIKKSGSYFIRGSKETPINFEIKAINSLLNFKINEININTLNAGEVIYIDSFNKKVVKNNQNAIDSVSIFEFPEAVGHFNIEISEKNLCEIHIDYMARW